jgi:hypothetical protein
VSGVVKELIEKAERKLREILEKDYAKIYKVLKKKACEICIDS